MVFWSGHVTSLIQMPERLDPDMVLAAASGALGLLFNCAYRLECFALLWTDGRTYRNRVLCGPLDVWIKWLIMYCIMIIQGWIKPSSICLFAESKYQFWFVNSSAKLILWLGEGGKVLSNSKIRAGVKKYLNFAKWNDRAFAGTFRLSCVNITAMPPYILL